MSALRAFVIFGAFTLSACVTTVRPPADLGGNPRPVFVLVLGNHSNLVVSTSDDRLIRYAYGDWRWYAEGHATAWNGIAALAWPTPAALGRRELTGPLSEDDLRRQIPLAIDAIYRVEVSGHGVDALQARLDAIFLEGKDSMIYRADYDLQMVPHPKAYTALHNSNRVVAEWLRELGCDVRGGYLLTRWRIAPPAFDGQ